MSLEQEFSKYKKKAQYAEEGMDYIPIDEVVNVSVNLVLPLDLAQGIQAYSSASGIPAVDLLIDILKNPDIDLLPAEFNYEPISEELTEEELEELEEFEDYVDEFESQFVACLYVKPIINN